jgi:hypothetical protein
LKNPKEMNLQKETAGSSKRMSKQERKQYFDNMDKEISNWAYQDQMKLDFSRRFVDDLQLFKGESSNRIQIGPLDKGLLEYLIFSILIEYERSLMES